MADDFLRIKSNVQKMVDQGAPEVDIDGYLSEEGLDAAQFKKLSDASARPYNDGFGIEAIDAPLRQMEAFNNKATDWMMLGKRDEIQAGMLSPFVAAHRGISLGDAYSTKLKELEGDQALAEYRAPIADNVGAVVGAVTGAPGQVGAKYVMQGQNMATRALRSLVPGVPIAAITGAEGDTLEERGKNALWSGAAAVPLAPAGQIGGEILGKFVTNLFRGKQPLPAVAQGKIADPAQAALRPSPGSPNISASDMDAGVQRLFKALEADGIDPQQVIALAQAGQLDDRTIAGIAGPNTRQLIDTFASMPGEAKTIVAGAQRAAEQGQSANIMKATAQNLGVKQSYTDLADVIETQKASAGPLYDAYYAISPDRLNTPFMQNLLKSPLSKELLATAQKLNQIEIATGKTPNDVFQHMLDADGNVSTQTALDPRAADYLKRALDQKVQDFIDPMTGKIKGGIGNAWDGLRRAFLRDIDAAAPEYAAARNAFSGPASMEDAMQLGRNILKEDWIANFKTIEALTASEKEALKVGVFQAMDDMLSGISNKADKAARLANIDKYLERIYPAFDSKKAFDAFKKSIMSQTSEFSAIQMAGKGSQTAPRIADMADQMMDTAENVAGAATGNKASLWQLAKQTFGRVTAPNAQARAAAVSGALAPVQNIIPMLNSARSAGAPFAGAVTSAATAVPSTRTREMVNALMKRGH